MTSPVKLFGRTRLGRLAINGKSKMAQASSFHLDSGNWPGDKAEIRDFPWKFPDPER